MKIAVIGSGISGLYSAWKLSKFHDITVYEKNNYFGGHTDTHLLQLDKKPIAVDSGFIVFNEHNYPVFSDMLRELNVESQRSDMSFSVNNWVSGIQYNPSKKWSLLAKPTNFLKKDFRMMLRDILRFYESNKMLSMDAVSAGLTIEDYLQENNYSQAFRYEHLYPMCGALWSTPVEQVGHLPYKFVVSFFQHHRMLHLNQRPQWLTVKGGSSQYVKAIQAQSTRIRWESSEVTRVERHLTEVKIHTHEAVQHYDWVIFACHADDSYRLIADKTPIEEEILGKFTYQDNYMVVHCDAQIMPRKRALWASWHVHVNQDIQQQTNYAFTYWMNRLQNLACQTQVFATLNPNLSIRKQYILAERHYRHPVFNQAALEAQQRWFEINGSNRSSFCGAYWGWGFHEDGARSAKQVVDHLLNHDSISETLI